MINYFIVVVVVVVDLCSDNEVIDLVCNDNDNDVVVFDLCSDNDNDSNNDDEVMNHNQINNNITKKKTKKKRKKKRNNFLSSAPDDEDDDDGATIDRRLKMISKKSLQVIDSIYTIKDGGGNLVIGKGLVCNTNIQKSQPIIKFKGNIKQRNEINFMDKKACKYLIMINENKFLDCRKMALNQKCMASMSNTAKNLYDEKNKKILTIHDNNSAINIINGDVVLYAIKDIVKGNEILCDYTGNGTTYTGHV